MHNRHHMAHKIKKIHKPINLSQRSINKAQKDNHMLQLGLSISRYITTLQNSTIPPTHLNLTVSSRLQIKVQKVKEKEKEDLFHNTPGADHIMYCWNHREILKKKSESI